MSVTMHLWIQYSVPIRHVIILEPFSVEFNSICFSVTRLTKLFCFTYIEFIYYIWIIIPNCTWKSPRYPNMALNFDQLRISSKSFEICHLSSICYLPIDICIYLPSMFCYYLPELALISHLHSGLLGLIALCWLECNWTLFIDETRNFLRTAPELEALHQTERKLRGIILSNCDRYRGQRR